MTADLGPGAVVLICQLLSEENRLLADSLVVEGLDVSQRTPVQLSAFRRELRLEGRWFWAAVVPRRLSPGPRNGL